MSMTTAEVIESLRNDDDFMRNVTHWEVIPPRPGRFEKLPPGLNPLISDGLRSRGIGRLYSHQAQAFERSLAGDDLVIVTPTASGKTLSYNLPVLQTILAGPDARALYLFPTKALSQDQQAALNEMTLGSDLGVKVATYDGDTPSSLRSSARETGQIIISNPDMMHAGILPNHPKWIKFLKNLRYIVIDELHAYRGIHGSHLANLIRRINRVCRFYGSTPRFICCSATIGNPRELAEAVTGRSMTLVDDNGAPSGEKHLVLYNPPLVDRVQGIRKGTVNESRRIALNLLRRGIKTIVFARSRVRVELIASYINQSLANMYSDNERIRVESYRGGYLPNERREIEKGLRSGEIMGVVSTNALELGIDIGGLDASVLAGFPGSISSVWQQAGRAGRTSASSIAVLVASSAPLDQYMVRHQNYFLSRGAESGYVNPENFFVRLDHVKCSAFELPFSADGDEDFPDAADYLKLMEEDGTVRLSGGRYYWSDRSYPAEGISLRSATADNVVIVDITKGRNQVIGEMDRPSAKELIYPLAVYIHRGRQFLVHELNLEERRCYVEEKETNFYTDAVVKRDIKVLLEDGERAVAGIKLTLADVLVRTEVAKFKKLRFNTHENIGFGEINLPEEEMHTQSAILIFDDSSSGTDGLIEGRDDSANSQGPATNLAAYSAPEQTAIISRLGSLIKATAPAFLLCDRNDFGISERIRDPHFQAPAIYIFDRYPGGSGVSRSLSGRLEEILGASLDLVSQCGCEEGCPSCIGPRLPEEEITVNPKPLIRDFISSWISTNASGR
jgi:DEAD/DEAH box helicase domain-containing protein